MRTWRRLVAVAAGCAGLGVVVARYRLPGLPVTFFLSRSGGRILGVNTGALTVRTLTAILRELYGRAA
jgi:hypothetical protein